MCILTRKIRAFRHIDAFERYDFVDFVISVSRGKVRVIFVVLVIFMPLITPMCSILYGKPRALSDFCAYLGFVGMAICT